MPGPDSDARDGDGAGTDSSNRVLRTPRRSIARTVASIVVVIAVVSVVWSAVIEVQNVESSTTPKDITFWDVDAAYWTCLVTQVKSAVPPGETVWVSQHAPNAPSFFEVLWKATAGIRPLSASRNGVTTLHLVRTSKGTGCLGVRVKATQPSGVVTYGSGTLPRIDWTRWNALHTGRSP